jgi:hypothetical protein
MPRRTRNVQPPDGHPEEWIGVRALCLAQADAR